MAQFKKFITDAKTQATGEDVNANLLSGFYARFSEDPWDVGRVIKYLEKKGYKLNPKDIVSLEELHEKTCVDWEFRNKDY